MANSVMYFHDVVSVVVKDHSKQDAGTNYESDIIHVEVVTSDKSMIEIVFFSNSGNEIQLINKTLNEGLRDDGREKEAKEG